MSNMIKGVDFGMGYEWTSEWGLRNQFHTAEGWVTSACPDQEAMNLEMAKGVFYRRPLPILANHPEAIPLEPGEVLQVGDRGLTRDGRDTGELVENKHDAWFASHPLHSEKLSSSFKECGLFDVDDLQTENDIIARLPKVAREAEKAKEEKVKNTITIKTSDDFRFCLGSGTITLGEKDISNLLAEVKRQEEAKRIGPGDWFRLGSSICRCASVEGDIIYSERWDKFAPQSGHRDNCRKIENPALIAALNAEIDGRAGG